MRAPWAALILIMLLLGAMPPSASASEAGPVERPSATPPYDLEPWQLGDSWTYFTTIRAASPDGTTTRARLNMTVQVAEVRSVTVGNLTYTAYNVTSTGTAFLDGRLSVTGPGANPIQLSGPASGWSWFDRSNLASVAVNESANLAGTIQVSFLVFPMTLNATTTLRYTPALEDLDFPLELGDAWSFDGRTNTTGVAVASTPLAGTFTQDLAGEGNGTFRAWFNGTEDVTPAATFLGSARVHALAPDGNTTDRWYHPDAKNLVKAEVHEVRGANDYFHLWTNLTAYSLVAPPPWPGSIVLTNPRVNPGGRLIASGTAGANEDLLVLLPAVGASYPVRSDAAGAWSLPLVAPLLDDWTPSNADVGSHGVLVEPASGPPGWDATTLQLIIPDLSVGPGDLAASDLSPLVGTAITFDGTVHGGTSVDVTSPFNVSFAIDGLEYYRHEWTGVAAGGTATYTGLSWTATTPGPHAVTFTADPDGVLDESDETNNSVTIVVFARGPDLSPWNVTVRGDTNATYVDPSAAGFVSAPIESRLGGIVDITFEAASVGDADVPAPFEVEVVETQGLRGPPVPGWRFSANATIPLPPGTNTGPWTASWAVPGGAGFYYLNVTVDAGGQVAESDEANNTFVVVVTVSGPDFRIGSVGAPPKVTAAASVTIPVEVRNDGQRGAAGDIPFAAYEGVSPTPFFTASVPALAVGGSYPVDVPWTSPSPAAASNLRFVVDPANLVEEMDESNNEAGVTIDVRDPPVTSISWSGLNATTDGLYVRGSTQFFLAATDLSGDGLTSYYRVDGGVTQPFAFPFTLVGNGPHAIAYWSEDNLGGVEVARALAVTVDDAPPSVAPTVGEQTGNRTMVSLSASDGQGVGVDFIEFRVDNGTWQRYTGPIVLEGYGSYFVEYRAVDRLSNEASGSLVAIGVPTGVVIIRANYKPFLAAAFAVALLVLGMIPRTGGPLLKTRRFQAALAFAVVEAATGVASGLTGVLRIPPYDAGVAVDLAIFLAGAVLILWIRRQVRPSAFVVPEAGTDK